MTDLSTCPLFVDSAVYKPFAYPWAVEVTQRHEKIHWTEEEADLGEDVADWKMGHVTDIEKFFITHTLRLFTQSDVAVGGFYYDNLIPRIRNNEVRVMLGSFAGREGTHQRAYANLVDTLGFPDSEFSAFRHIKEMADKMDHMTEADTSTDEGLLLALAKGVANEGISLFASFAMLLSFQRDGKMKGMGKIVEWSQRDETVHVYGIAWLFRTLATARPELVTPELKLAIYEMIRRTVDLEDAFIDAAYAQGDIKNLPKEDVKQYIRFVADRRLTQLGLKENWQIEENPLPWVDWLVAGADFTNFFEGKVTDYEVAGMQGEWGYSNTRGQTRPQFVVYTKSGCPYCVKVKQVLVEADAGFTTIDLSDDELRQVFYNRHGFGKVAGAMASSMPKVFEVVHLGNGTQRMVLVGGCAETERLIDTRKGRTRKAVL